MNSTSQAMHIRQATPADLGEIMRVEESWPETERATKEKMIARLEKFPQGFLLAEIGGIVRGTITACPVRYAPDHLAGFASWDQVTNRGFFYEPKTFAGCNGLYLASGVIETGFRGGGCIEQMITAEVETAGRWGYRYVVAGAVLPGYDAYCRKHGDLEAWKYVTMKKGHRMVDPFMEIYRTLGFSVPGRDHVIENYYPDGASRHYAALVVKSLP